MPELRRFSIELEGGESTVRAASVSAVVGNSCGVVFEDFEGTGERKVLPTVSIAKVTDLDALPAARALLYDSTDDFDATPVVNYHPDILAYVASGGERGRLGLSYGCFVAPLDAYGYLLAKDWRIVKFMYRADFGEYRYNLVAPGADSRLCMLNETDLEHVARLAGWPG